MEVAGQDGDAYLVVDGPVGAIVSRDLPEPLILPVASILAHREFDPYDGPLPRGLTVGLATQMAQARERFEAGDPVSATK
jgi:hypothetical protein